MDVLNNVPIIDRLDEAIDLFFSFVFVIWSATVANMCSRIQFEDS